MTLGDKCFSLDMGEGDQFEYGLAIIRAGQLQVPKHRGTGPLEMAWGAPPGL